MIYLLIIFCRERP